jgi:hypothetical protein
MPRGAPDDSNIRIETGVYRLDDMAELGVRLGSPLSYHRYGNVLFMDGFEEGVNAWTLTRNGTSSDVLPSVTRSYQGKISCKIVTGTGATPNAGILKYLPPVDECPMGLQATFALDTNIVYIDFRVTYGKAPTLYYFWVRYTHATGTLTYYDQDGAMTLFATPGVLWDQAGNWHNAKIIVDTAGKEYVRFYLDNVAYSMTDLTPETAAWGYGGFVGPLLHAYGNGTVSGTLYLDNVIVTFNEV